MGKISRDCDKDVTSGKVGAHATFWVKWAKDGPKSSLDRLIRKEDYVGLPTDNFCQGRRPTNSTFSENSEPLW